MIKVLLDIVLLLTAIPVGYFLAWLCKDEIIYRKWMNLILYCLIIVGIVYSLIYFDINIILAFIYMIIITLVSIYKSKDKKFLKS